MKYSRISIIAFSLLLAATQSVARPITRSQARQVAEKFVTINDTVADDTVIKPYYVFSRGAGQGYVFVSGDDATTPILGYTDQGDFDTDNMPEGQKAMLDGWAERISRLQQQTSDAQAKDNRQRLSADQRLQKMVATAAGREDVAPLIQTHWHQSYPYNMLAPYRTRGTNRDQAMTGCEATAASQIIYYFRKDNPDHLLYATPTYDESWFNAPVTMSLPAGTKVDYSIMKLSGTGTLKQDSAVAILMYAAGTCAHLGYGYQDGTSTAGDTDKMGAAMSSQFNLRNDYLGKWNYAQTGWEQIIYGNLKKRQPMLYSGSNSGGGHAVVLDGYQASTNLFHFNFGWGGLGDGYYTVDDSTGMNGYNESQAILGNIEPKKQNMTGSLIVPKLYRQVDADVKAEISNNGTLDYTGLRLYANYTPNFPNTATDEDNKTSILSGDKAVVTLSFRPSRVGTCYLFLTDKNGNLLDSTHVEVTNPVPDMHLNSLSMNTSDETITVDGQDFRVVNNTKVDVAASFTNSEQGSTSQPRLKAQLYTYDSESKTWTKGSSRTISSLVFEPGQTRDTVFRFTSLDPTLYYKVVIDPEVKGSVTTQLSVDTPDSVVYFVVRKSTLAVSVSGRKATVTGAWDAALFSENATNSRVTSYDMTAVTGLKGQPQAANANAVFYCSENIAARNIVANGVCDSLVITEGQEFAPAEGFTARKARYQTTDEGTSTRFGVTLVPFEVADFDDIQARVLTELRGSRLQMRTLCVIPAMTPVVYLSSVKGAYCFEAIDVTISADTIGTDSTGLLQGSTLATSATSQQSLLTVSNGVSYFSAAADGESIEPFGVKLNATNRINFRIQDTSRNTSVDLHMVELSDSLAEATDEIANAPVSEAYKKASLDEVEKIRQWFHINEASTYDDVVSRIDSLSAIMTAFRNGVANGIETITDPQTAVDNNTPIEYYNAAGQRINGLQKGIVIIRQGNKTRKLLVK